MVPETLSNDALLQTLSATAVRSNAADLDLIGSCRRLNSICTDLMREVLRRMEGDDDSNRELLTDLMAVAIKAATDDNPRNLRKRYFVKKRRLLDMMSAPRAEELARAQG